jgi:hypothetical protein
MFYEMLHARRGLTNARYGDLESPKHPPGKFLIPRLTQLLNIGGRCAVSAELAARSGSYGEEADSRSSNFGPTMSPMRIPAV